VRWLFCLGFAACGSSTPKTTRPEPARPQPAAAVIPVNDRECGELIDHAVALGMAEQPHATDADRDAVRASVSIDFLHACRALRRDRYTCAIAARTLAELEACQPMPSSSTSNSSVAPGGMTFPAPRSP